METQDLAKTVTIAAAPIERARFSNSYPLVICNEENERIFWIDAEGKVFFEGGESVVQAKSVDYLALAFATALKEMLENATKG